MIQLSCAIIHVNQEGRVDEKWIEIMALYHPKYIHIGCYNADRIIGLGMDAPQS